MTLPRKQLISIKDTPYYHIVTRCVRRAFSCGKDKYSGKCYEYRRRLIVNRIKQLAEVFNIMIYIPVNPTACRLRRSNLILSNLAVNTLQKPSMAYVDLNPIRAAMASAPEDSDYTSIQERIRGKKSNLLNLGFGEDDIPFGLGDYCSLVDLTGRTIIANKRGYIPEELPDILHRLNLNSGHLAR